MKKILYTWLMLLLAGVCSAGTHTFADHSVLANGTFVKVSVTGTGLHSLSYDALRDMGLNPDNVRIYGYGGAMLHQSFNTAHIDDLPLVPVYRDAAGERIIFFAQGPISWNYNGTRFTHTRNTYSHRGYYFLTSSKGATEEVPMAEVVAGSPIAEITTYTNYQLHEKDSINLIDRSGVNGGGRDWFGEQFSPGNSRQFRFSFPGIAGTNQSMRVYARMAAYAQTTSTFQLSVGNTSYTANAQDIKSSDFYTRGTEAIINQKFTPAVSESQNVTLRFSNSASTALGFLDYIELTAECALRLPANAPLYFRSTQGVGSGSVYRFAISNATSATQVWDVTDRSHIVRMPATLTDNTLRFTAVNRTVREYVAFTPGAVTLSAPANEGSVSNQDLHALTDIDMVIISPAEFISEARRLSAAHAQYDNLTMAVVTDRQVYNEFSSGTPDATAYRLLMKMLYDRAAAGQGHKPRFLLLFGDGTFDNRGILGTYKTGTPWLLTYQAKNSLNEVKAYATDDYFGFLEDKEGDSDIQGTMDIAVGRLPVNSTEQAQQVVNKLINHISGTTRGSWKRDLLFLADDGDGNLHTQCSDGAAESVRQKNPDFVTNKVYLDAYTQEVTASGEKYPLAEKRVNRLLKDGVTLFDYCGHSGYNNATSEGLVSIATIRAMKNAHQGFWMFASCSFALFDAGKSSAAEEAILNPDGGALAVCGANRTVYASQNATLNRHICDSLFHHSSVFTYGRTIGEAVRLGKNACGSDDNKLSYVLLGDPAVSPRYPSDYEVITTAIPDTLRALSENEVQGYIRTEEGDTATWFNGRLNISVYDKMQQVTTLDNDEPNVGDKSTYTYNDYPNILYSGDCPVINGRFRFTFMVPKDIRYNYGTGRIVYYAQDTVEHEEAIGHHHSFIIGGSSVVEVLDTIGPEMQLYIGSPAFRNGDRTSETPHFFAHLSDPHGINRVGSGIGHDLLLVVDDNPRQTYVLNDAFTADPGSYTSGLVSYLMPELREGMHTLTFRAWDLMNNSSTGTLNFEVVSGLNPSIVSLTTYPNPVAAGDRVNIAIEYDQPDVQMQTDVYVYDLSGRLVYNYSQQGTETIRWDLSTSRVPAGVYMYKVQLSNENTRTISKSGKLIIH